MHILIIGGTGFIGYHAVQEFLHSGHQVSVIALPLLATPDLLAPQVHIHFTNIEQASDQALKAILQGVDALIFAAGADDRLLPDRPAYEFFHQANVETTSRIIRLARQAGVKRGVIIGSYFAHFARLWPEMGLCAHHPYIRSRVIQEQQSFKAASPGMEVMVLELPFVFGAMPGQAPLWTPLIRYLRSPLPLVCPRGGTNAIAVQQVAKAILGAVEKGKAGETYLVGGDNLTYVALLKRLMQASGKTKIILPLPNWLLKASLACVKAIHRIRGKESGLDPVLFVDLLTKNTFFDSASSRAALGYDRGGLREALADTIEACI